MSRASASLVSVLRARAAEVDQPTAFTFLAEAQGPAQAWTWRDLDTRARAIAAELQRGALTGERIVLLYPPGLEFVAAFFGCLYSGAVAVPAHPPSLRRPTPRLQTIVADAKPAAVLTTPSVARHRESLEAHNPELSGLRWVSTESLHDASGWREVSSPPWAMLQYTSGSTAAPKGVALTHRNLLHNLEVIREAFGLGRSDRGVFWLPPYHDMGLIGGILTPVYAGFPATLMSPASFLRSPWRWLETVSDRRATVSGAPNFAYELCIERFRPEKSATLDLSHWKVAFNGAEPVRAATLERFASVYRECGFAFDAFLPCYGLAESTLLVAGRPRTKPIQIVELSKRELEAGRAVPSRVDARQLVSCGVPHLSLRIEIVHPEDGKAVEPGGVGEIWVAGESVASGYWNQPSAAFGARLSATEEDMFLRTGDLGFLHQGELFVAGRLKDLIIVRGRKHHPQDLERTAEASHPAVRRGGVAAVVRGDSEGEGDVKVALVAEVDLRLMEDEVCQALSHAVAREHGIPVEQVALIQAGSLPRTSSGKVRRHACRELLQRGELALVVPLWSAPRPFV